MASEVMTITYVLNVLYYLFTIFVFYKTVWLNLWSEFLSS
jgi:hypothetical protein